MLYTKKQNITCKSANYSTQRGLHKKLHTSTCMDYGHTPLAYMYTCTTCTRVQNVQCTTVYIWDQLLDGTLCKCVHTGYFAYECDFTHSVLCS